MSVPATTTSHLPALRAEAIDEAREPLGKLFLAYDEQWMGGKVTDENARARQALIDGKVNAYLDALQGVPAWAVDQARLDFLQGRVDRKLRHKLPTAEELSTIAREHVRLEAARQLQERRRAEQAAEAQRIADEAAGRSSP
jgi:hypothetical protein